MENEQKSLEERVNSIKKNNLASQTKNSYNRAERKLKQWLFSKHPEIFIDDEINLELFTPDHFHQYLVSLKTRDGRDPGVQVYNGARSALKNMYRKKEMPLPERFVIPNEIFFRGLKRKHAKEKQDGERKLHEGKSAMPFKLYERLCKEMLKSGNAFAHLYLILSWNLMCRTDNTSSIVMPHLNWENDCLVVFFGKMKNDQEGETLRDGRHVYANPMNPSVCPILALSIYLMTIPCGPRLFPGSRQASRFSKQMQRYLKKNPSLFTDTGILSPDEIGTHSCRKGSPTFCLSGCTGGPDIASVCNRCGWKLPGVLDRYIKYEKAGDMFTGRTASGLPLNSENFAMLPFHFDPQLHLDARIKELFPASEFFSELKCIYRFCLAAIVGHVQFLRDELPSNHALFSTKLFTSVGVIENLQEHLYGGTRSRTSPFIQPTGIPPHIEIMQVVSEILRQQKIQTKDIIEQMDQLLESKGVRAGNITHEHLKSLIQECVQQVRLEVQSSQVSSDEKQEQQPNDWGSLRIQVPESFRLPSVDCFIAWDLWHNGKPSERLPPFKIIPYQSVADPSTRKALSDWKRMMKVLENFFPPQGDEHEKIKKSLRNIEEKMGASKKRPRIEQLKVLTLSRLVKKIKVDQ